MKICKVKGCDNKILANSYCNKHCHQLRRCGKILKRTTSQKNETKLVANTCYMNIYNNHSEKIAVTKFSKKYYKEVVKHKWHISHDGYAATTLNSKRTSLHVFIKGKRRNLVLDHIDRDKLNNEDNNLRFVTLYQNSINRESKGYSWSKQSKKWKVVVTINKVKKYFGLYKTEKEAKKVADKVIEERYKKVFG